MISFTDDDRALARNLAKSPETMAFLTRVFAPEDEPAEVELAKNVAALDDAEYGRLMKVIYITKQSFRTKLALLKKLGSGSDEPSGPKAPK